MWRNSELSATPLFQAEEGLTCSPFFSSSSSGKFSLPLFSCSKRKTATDKEPSYLPLLPLLCLFLRFLKPPFAYAFSSS